MVDEIKLNAVSRNGERRIARIRVAKNGTINGINLARKRCFQVSVFP